MQFDKIFLAVALSGAVGMSAANVPVASTALVGDGIALFVPQGYDPSKTPSLMLEKEPVYTGALPSSWNLVPEFTLTDGKGGLSSPASTVAARSQARCCATAWKYSCGMSTTAPIVPSTMALIFIRLTPG